MIVWPAIDLFNVFFVVVFVAFRRGMFYYCLQSDAKFSKLHKISPPVLRLEHAISLMRD